MPRILAIVILSLILAASFSLQAHALTVKNIRFGGEGDKQRIVVELDKAADYQSFTTRNPNRIIIDMPDFDWSVKNIQKPVSSNISDIRHGTVGGGKARIVFDTREPSIIVSSFMLAADAKQPNRMVIDFRHADKTPEQDQMVKGGKAIPTENLPADLPLAIPSQSAPSPTTQLASREGTLGTLVIKQAKPTPVHQKAEPETVSAKARDKLKTLGQNAIVTTPYEPQETAKAASENQQPPLPDMQRAEEIAKETAIEEPVAIKSFSKSSQKPLIIIDPGHGGQDPGAKAANGNYEKVIVLAVGLELKKALEDSGRYRVKMTRATDVFIPLRERVRIAKRNGGDLFISLHADSMRNSEVSGASVYTLSNTASDKETEKLAERENKSDAIAGVNLDGQDNDVANILIDLVSRDTMNQSRYLANTVVDTFPRNGVQMLPRQPHRSAGFAVLKAMDIPSILVEMGYVTNLAEAEKLSSQPHRQRIARALRASVDSYFTRIAQQSFD